MLLEKLPPADPSLVCEPFIAGLCEVLQHIPLAVILDPPLDVISPPAVALFLVISEAGIVFNEGKVAEVVKVRSSPYAVPALFVA